MKVLASQLHFLANRNAGLAIPPLFWPVNCIKRGEHVALLSGHTVFSLYRDQRIKTRIKNVFLWNFAHGIITEFLKRAEKIVEVR